MKTETKTDGKTSKKYEAIYFANGKRILSYGNTSKTEALKHWAFLEDREGTDVTMLLVKEGVISEGEVGNRLGDYEKYITPKKPSSEGKKGDAEKIDRKMKTETKTDGKTSLGTEGHIQCGRCGNKEFTLRCFFLEGKKSIVADCKCGKVVEYRNIEEAIDLTPYADEKVSNVRSPI